MKLSVLMILPILWNIECGSAVPVEQGSITEASVTPYPDAQKRYVNVHNVSPEVSSLLESNGMSMQSVQTLQAQLLSKNHTLDANYRYEMVSSSTGSTPTEAKERDEQMRLIVIRNSLEKTLRESPDDSQPTGEFEYSLPAVCDVPKHTNLTEWFNTNSWNVLFKPNYKQYNVKSLTMRIFKVSSTGAGQIKDCDPDVGEFVKISISVYSRKNKEFKKRLMHARLVQANYHGWLEIDALSTLKFWNHQKNNYGLAIDVFDSEDKQLDAREHFHLQNCEAGVILPWGSFKLLAESQRTENTDDLVNVFRDVYTGPRLDLISTKVADYYANSAEQQRPQQQSSRRHARHNHRHHPRSSEEVANESSSHETTAEQRNHSHRSNSYVEET